VTTVLLLLTLLLLPLLKGTGWPPTSTPWGN